MGVNMAKILLPISIVILLISACEPKTVSYEKATKWHSECNPYPGYHPGDYYAYEDVCLEECKGTVNCDKDSTSLPNESHWDYSSCARSWNICKNTCIHKKHPIAVHVEGGYYSDGSYYATCVNDFENVHPTRKKYEKTQWQKARDECMELTFKNVTTWWKRNRRHLFLEWSYQKWLKRAKKYYKSCLKERGYGG